jgi:hypothetical protein
VFSMNIHQHGRRTDSRAPLARGGAGRGVVVSMLSHDAPTLNNCWVGQGGVRWFTLRQGQLGRGGCGDQHPPILLNELPARRAPPPPCWRKGDERCLASSGIARRRVGVAQVSALWPGRQVSGILCHGKPDGAADGLRNNIGSA